MEGNYSSSGEVTYRHFTSILEPVADVLERQLGTVLPDSHGFLVVRTEELVAPVGIGGVASVLAQIEHLRVDADPVQVAGQFLRDVRLPAGR